MCMYLSIEVYFGSDHSSSKSVANSVTTWSVLDFGDAWELRYDEYKGKYYYTLKYQACLGINIMDYGFSTVTARVTNVPLCDASSVLMDCALSTFKRFVCAHRKRIYCDFSVRLSVCLSVPASLSRSNGLKRSMARSKAIWLYSTPTVPHIGCYCKVNVGTAESEMTWREMERGWGWGFGGWINFRNYSLVLYFSIAALYILACM